MEALAALLPTLVEIAKDAPGVLAKLFGVKTDEEALAHARATLAAVGPLGPRIHAAAEARRAELAREHDERTDRGDEPTVETFVPGGTRLLRGDGE